LLVFAESPFVLSKTSPANSGGKSSHFAFEVAHLANSSRR